MKQVISWLIWLFAVASFLLLFFEPYHSWVPYAKNYIAFYEIFLWFFFIFLSAVALLFLVAKTNGGVSLKEPSKPEDLKKALKMFESRRYHFFCVLNYTFIAFVGIFVGDLSVAAVLLLNSVVTFILRKLMKEVFEGVCHES